VRFTAEPIALHHLLPEQPNPQVGRVRLPSAVPLAQLTGDGKIRPDSGDPYGTGTDDSASKVA
jgi:hypothetical protein